MATVLDTVFLRLQLEVEQMRRELNDVTERMGELDEQTRRTSEELTNPAPKIAGNMLNELTGMVTKAAAAYFSLKSVVKSVRDYLSGSLELGTLSSDLNENIETVNAFGQAVARNGGSVEGFSQSLAGLTDKMRRARLEGDTSIYAPLARLGVGGFGANTKGTDLMLRIAERMKAMSSAAALTFGRELGFDDATIRTLQQGRGEVEKLIAKYRELGVYTQKDFEQSKRLKTAIQDLKQAFTMMTVNALRPLIPILEAVTKKLMDITNWMRENEQTVKIAFVAMAAAVTTIMLPALARLTAGWIKAFAPFLLLAGAIFLLIDDFMMYKKFGKDASLLGGVYEEIERFKDEIMSIVTPIKNLFTDLKDGATSFEEALERLVTDINFDNLSGPIKWALALLVGAVYYMNKFYKIWKAFREHKTTDEDMAILKGYSNEDEYRLGEELERIQNLMDKAKELGKASLYVTYKNMYEKTYNEGWDSILAGKGYGRESVVTNNNNTNSNVNNIEVHVDSVEDVGTVLGEIVKGIDGAALYNYE
jgi:methyl-accepting chemotaxis protein